MKKARFELSSPSNSIHLVPKRRIEEGSLPGDVHPDTTRPLPAAMPPLGIMCTFNSRNEGSANSHDRKPVSAVNQAAVLRELFELLEDYSPIWYTEETHERAVAALKLAMR